MQMDYATAIGYYNAITVIEAQDRLVDFQVASFPNYESKDRDKIHREYYKLAFSHKEQDVMTSEQLEGFLKTQGVL